VTSGSYEQLLLNVTLDVEQLFFAKNMLRLGVANEKNGVWGRVNLKKAAPNTD